MGKAGKKKGGEGKKAGNDDDAILDAALQAAGAEREKTVELEASGDDYATQGNWAMAIGKYTAAITKDPNNGVCFSKRSVAYMCTGKMADSSADAKAGAALGGKTPTDSAYCHSHYGFMLLREGQVQAARDEFAKGLKLCATHPGCRQGHSEAAVAIERANGKKQPLTKRPEDVDAQELLSLPTPEEVLGKGFEVVRLKVKGFERTLTFLLSTTHIGLPVITPKTCAMLNLQIKRRVELPEVCFESGEKVEGFKECEVTGFVQAEIAERALGSVLHGIVGLSFLTSYDIDLDRVRREQRVKKTGQLARDYLEMVSDVTGSSRIGALPLRCLPLPGDLLGLAVRARMKGRQAVTVAGIIDTGSMFSIMNWKAAKELGIGSSADDPKFQDATKVVGATKDGPSEMPLVHLKMSLLATPSDVRTRLGGVNPEEFKATGQGSGWSLDFREKDMVQTAEFGSVNVAIGDAIQFELLRDSSVGEYNAGAILVGQDILVQAPRLAVSAKERTMWMDPPGRIMDAPPV